MKIALPSFSKRIIQWQTQHGRHSLPWQNTRDPYPIWVSEIMLQQTQVATVLNYFQKFMQRFPTVDALAQAPLPAVLQNWSGLGYYSRARNLHKAAGIICTEHAGIFPRTAVALETLPGIGRSTAAAISAFAFGEHAAILDGNVKRVFARHFAIAGWPGAKKVETQLWQLAQTHLPDSNIEAYTQGLMDLGAALCTRTRPQCLLCPLNTSCVAHQKETIALYPAPKPKVAHPIKEVDLALVIYKQAILLERRPPSGIWGGLLSLPETSDVADFISRWGKAEKFEALPNVKHTFTHFTLWLKTTRARLLSITPQARAAHYEWLPFTNIAQAELPAPIKKILLQTIAPEQ